MKDHLWAKKVDKAIFKGLWGVSLLSGGSLVIVALLCTVDALGAKFFSASVPNGTEWVTFLNIPVVFFAMGFIQVERGHTVVDIIAGKFPPIIKKAIKIVGDLLGAFICIVVGYFEIILTMDKYGSASRASSASTSFLVWPFALIIAIGFFTVAVAFAWSIFREVLIPVNERMGAIPEDENQLQEHSKTEMKNYEKLMEEEGESK